MSLTSEGLSAADVAAVTGNNGGFGSFGGDGAWWLLVLFLFAFNGNWGNNGGNGGNYGYGAPYVVTDVQRGFDQSAVMGGLSGIQSAVTNGFIDTAAALCNGFAGVNGAISNGFAQAEIANNARQMANMQQAFALQSQFADCCCENRLASADLKYTIALIELRCLMAFVTFSQIRTLVFREFLTRCAMIRLMRRMRELPTLSASLQWPILRLLRVRRQQRFLQTMIYRQLHSNNILHQFRVQLI